MGYITEVPQHISVMVRMAKCNIVYSPRYCGLVISHYHISEILYCRSDIHLERMVKMFIEKISTIGGVVS